MMQKIKLVVEVHARIDWIEPPKDANESVMREYLNNIAVNAGKRMEPAVQLLVAEFLDSHKTNL